MASIAIFNEPDSGTTLAADITAGTGTITYTGADVFATGDHILIDDELIIVGTVNAGANALNNCVRGLWSAQVPQAAAAAHPSGAAIRFFRPYPSAARRVSQAAVNNHYQPAFGSAENALVYMVNAAQDRALSINAEGAQDTGRQQAASDETTYRSDAAVDMPVVT